MPNTINTTNTINSATEKRCPCCGIVKPKTTEFFGLRSRYKKKDHSRYIKDFNSYCKDCLNERSKKSGKILYEKNKKRINKKHREWYRANKEARSETINLWQDKNKERFKQIRRRWERNNRRTSAKAAICHRMSANMRGCLSGRIKNNRSWTVLVDYTIEQLMAHIEDQFKDGMSWENRGEWHIDHIRPIASFDFKTTDDDDFKKCWALKNLQPLWATDNIKKKDKWDGVTNG